MNQIAAASSSMLRYYAANTGPDLPIMEANQRNNTSTLGINGYALEQRQIKCIQVIQNQFQLKHEDTKFLEKLFKLLPMIKQKHEEALHLVNGARFIHTGKLPSVHQKSLEEYGFVLNALQEAKYKKKGYIQRLFSNENWDEWTDQKTSLGKIIGLFTNYLENNAPLSHFSCYLDRSTLKNGEVEAQIFLKKIPKKIQKQLQANYNSIVAEGPFVKNPIPNLVVRPKDKIAFSLDSVFQDTNKYYVAITSQLRNRSSLPNWISLQYTPTLASEQYSYGPGVVFMQSTTTKNLALISPSIYDDHNSQFIILNASKPSAFQTLSFSETPIFNYIQGVTTSEDGNIAFISIQYNSNSVMQIINITNPTDPQWQGSVQLSTGAGALTAQNNFIYTSIYQSGLQIIDASNPDSPQVVGIYSNPLTGYKFCTAKGNLVFLQSQNTGFFVLDVSNPVTPYLIGNFLSEPISDIQVTNNLALATGANNLYLFDITNESDIKLLSTYPIQGIESITITGNLAIIGTYTGTTSTYVIDISDGSNPILLGSSVWATPQKFYSTCYSITDSGLVLNQGTDGNEAGAFFLIELGSPIFEGTAPLTAQNITIPIQVTGMNRKSAYAQDFFSLTVKNTSPVIKNPIPNQTILINEPYQYTFSPDAFFDADGDLLTYTAAQWDGQPLADWLIFDTLPRTFSGSPPVDSVGTIALKITANDGYGGYGDAFFNIKIVSSIPPVPPAPDNSSTLALAISISSATTVAGFAGLYLWHRYRSTQPITTLQSESTRLLHLV